LGRKREGRVSEKEAFKGAGGFGGPVLLDRGVEDVEKETREIGEGGEKVRSFGERRLRNLEESELLNFASVASVTGRWPAP
jgi:hypothetical protein